MDEWGSARPYRGCQGGIEFSSLDEAASLPPAGRSSGTGDRYRLHLTRERRLLWPQLGWNETAEWDTGTSLSNARLLRWTWYNTGGMDTLVGGTRWAYPLGPGNPPAVQAEYLPLRDHLGSTVMLMTAEYTTDLGQFYDVFAEPEPPPGRPEPDRARERGIRVEGRRDVRL